ncbi:MAG: ABC transporter ATP-binding protein [Planctomycetota bacterium]|jgi:ABC-2 type transport system ATP-binding protein
MIEVENLTKWFDDTRAVDDISFSVRKGEVLGFLGPNGAGKTTTLRVLTCFLLPTSGTARIAGHNIYENPTAIRRRIGYLAEESPLYHDMNVLDFLSFVAEVHGLSGAVKLAAVSRVVKTCGITEMKHKDITELSRGFKQRVGLAMAMLHDPDILFLDEPTSGLDPNQIREIRNLITEIGREKTVVLSTHRLEDVSATCTRVIIINRGRLVADAPPDRLQAESSSRICVKLAVRGPHAEVADAVGAVEGVKSVLVTSEGEIGELSRFEVVPEGDTEIAEKLFGVVRDRGWSLAELRTEKASLEEVFRELTVETGQEA